MHSFYNNKRVLVTGHTGFKGSWMIQMLHHLGAIVYGIALPPKEPSLFSQIPHDDICTNYYIDITNAALLKQTIADIQPDIIFHMAAQALVKDSYIDPITTYNTNVMGTLYVLEAIRGLTKKCISVFITTDKVYENPEDGRLFKENDALGGYDPYSSSKACDEILIHSYKRSFFSQENISIHQQSIASVRAGNVIGGGDYADNRIIPDIVRSIQNNTAVALRNPNAVRPWQHVIEPVFAYLLLANKMYNSQGYYNESYNIGPEKSDILKVIDITKSFIDAFGTGSYTIDQSEHPHEANLLLLDNSKIKNEIGFSPKLNANEAIQWTASWYASTENAYNKCMDQIEKYLAL